MKFTPSVEAMSAVTHSKLGSELEAIWQEVIDYRDKDLKDISFANKINAIQTFFAKKTAKKFMDCVWKNTGLNIEAVFFKPDFATSFCTWMCYGKGDELTDAGTRQISGILNGQANAIVHDWFADQEFTVDELIGIAKSYDVEKGIIKPEHRAAMKKCIRCAMGFDISLGFLSCDYLPKNSGVEYLNARELTAIMLHEIGHNLTMVEHAADMYAHVSAFDALRNAFVKHATPQSAIYLGKRVADLAIKSGFTKDGNALLQAANQGEKDVMAGGNKYASDLGKNCFVGGMVSSAFTLLFDVVTVGLDIICCDPTRKLLRTKAGQNKKLGDILVNERMWTWQERKADEYAFTHGYGADQVSALEKIMKFYRLAGRSESDIRAILKAEADGKNLSLYTKIRLSHLAHSLMSDLSMRLYPPGSERYKEILQLTIKELKAHGADADYVNKYTADIERMIRSIDSMSREDKYFEAAWNRYKVFMKFVSVRSFLSWFTNGRVDIELQETLDRIQHLNNNLLSYYGAKFEQLSKKA